MWISALLAIPGVLAGENPMPSPPPVPGKVAIIQIQAAILSTQEGRKAAGEVQSQFAPKKAELDQKKNQIAQLQAQLQQGSAALSDDAKTKLEQEIEEKTKQVNREAEDDQADYNEAVRKAMQKIGERLMPLMTRYAKENGYSLVLDVGSQQSPVVFASDTIDITAPVVELYDKSTAAPAAPTPKAPASPAKP